MLVGEQDFNEVLAHLSKAPRLSFDTETTGLRPYHGDRLFSMIFYDGEEVYYFNFQEYEGVTPLPRSYIKSFTKLFHKFGPVLDIANAKYDMHIMHQEGIEIKNKVWCTQVQGRVQYNDHMKYGLDAAAKRIGEEKFDTVNEYIKKHKLWEWVHIPGKKKRDKIKYYDRVPLEVMQPYAEQDAIVCWKVGTHQREEICLTTLSSPTNKGTMTDVAEMEMENTHVLYTMERDGVMVDREYCTVAAVYEEARADGALSKIREITGQDFTDSGKWLGAAFANLGLDVESAPRTPTGAVSFSDDYLSTVEHPIAEQVQLYRDASARGGKYFRGFLYYADSNGLVHADNQQGGTATGRLSCRDPNLQNLTKEDDGCYKVRACIVPEPGHFLVSIDYDQMEFRLMLDYAGQDDLIKQILDGYDPHTATADLVGIDRRPAKVLNFGLLYGMGLDLLALKLGCTRDEAREYKRQYFSRLPRVKEFIKEAQERTESRGFVFDWLGRHFYCGNKNLAYKSANSVIQGGCSSVVKVGMNNLHQYLKDKRSRMLIQIHDEILFSVHNEEAWVIPYLKSIMEAAYPSNKMPLTCSVTYSEKNFYEMKEWSDAL